MTDITASSSSQQYAAARERAQSRFAVLQSLHKAYGGSDSGNTTSASGTGTTEPEGSLSGGRKGLSTKSWSNVNSSDKEVANNAVELLVQAIDDPSIRSKNYFRDTIRGKAIVVGNLKLQIDASKSKKRIELANKRSRRISNRQLKKLCAADPNQICAAMPPPIDSKSQESNERAKFSNNCRIRPDIVKLHDIWWRFTQSIMYNCHSESQLQSRLNSMELIGARICVLEEKNRHRSSSSRLRSSSSSKSNLLHRQQQQLYQPSSSSSSSATATGLASGVGGKFASFVGLQGILVATTKHCFHLVPDPQDVLHHPGVAGVRKRKYSDTLMLIKNDVVLGIQLPAITKKPKSTSSSRTNMSDGNPNSSSSSSLDHQEIMNTAPDADTAAAAAAAGSSDPKQQQKVLRYDHNTICGIHGGVADSSGSNGNNNNNMNDNKSNRGRVFILYGKSFMPYCEFPK